MRKRCGFRFRVSRPRRRRGAVFQYTVPVAGGKGGSAAFLWVPPHAQQVRGVILAGMTLMEREFVKDPFIKWNDPYWGDAGARYFFTNLKWVGDGQTFEAHPVYADAYPAQHNGQGPRWLEAGQPVGHASAPIQLKPVSGPVVATGSNTFRMRYDALAPATEGARVTFKAYSAGDAEYRHTEHVGMMNTEHYP